MSERDRQGPEAPRKPRPRRRGDGDKPVLPDHTRDEEGVSWGEREYDDDERLRREVPPHHG